MTGLNPFLALRVVLDPTFYAPPAVGQLPESLRWWPLAWYLSRPDSFYVALMATASALLVVPSILVLRRMAQSTVTFQTWLRRKLTGDRLERRKKPRGVWANPIAWREAKTKGSAARAGLLRYAFIALGLGAVCAAVVLYSTERAEPAKSIDAGGFDAAAQTVFVRGDGVYGVAPGVAVTQAGEPLAGDPASLLNRRLAVNSLQTALFGDRRLITAIDVAPVDRYLSADATRKLLLGLVFLEVATILLIVTNVAANTVTREKEDGSLDLLLTTPITSRYYLWGKLRGLVSFVLPLLVVPVASVGVFVAYDLFRRALGGVSDPIALPEALLVMPGLLVVFVAAASVVGMLMSLRSKTTVRSVMGSVGIVAGVCAALGWCGFQIIDGSANPVALAAASFSPFTLLTLLIDPLGYAGGAYASDPLTARLTVIAFGLAGTAAYGVVVWTMYKSMVKNFDMTIRRQQR